MKKVLFICLFSLCFLSPLFCIPDGAKVLVKDGDYVVYKDGRTYYVEDTSSEDIIFTIRFVEYNCPRCGESIYNAILNGRNTGVFNKETAYDILYEIPDRIKDFFIRLFC